MTNKEIKDSIIKLVDNEDLNDLIDDYAIIKTFSYVYNYLGKDCNYLNSCTELIIEDEKLFNIIKERINGLR